MANRVAQIKTNLGSFSIELFEDKAPKTTKNFIVIMPYTEPDCAYAGRLAVFYDADAADAEIAITMLEGETKVVAAALYAVTNLPDVQLLEIARVDPITNVTPDDVERILKINNQGVLWGFRTAAAKFRSLGHKGKNINVSSIAGHDGFEMLGVNSAVGYR